MTDVFHGLLAVAGRLVRRSGSVYDLDPAAARAMGRVATSPAEVAVFSLVGVLGITLVLVLVVAVAARLILGR